MKFDFFTIWFMISPFIILHLILKNKEFKSKADGVLDHINTTWDNDYKEIIKLYGSMDNFIEAHEKDYDIIRDYLLRLYAEISVINREYMLKTMRLLDNKAYTKQQLYDAIKIIERATCEDTDAILTQLNAFIIDEENAHKNNKRVKDILDEIDEKYKVNDIYK